MTTRVRKATMEDAAAINRLSAQLGYPYPLSATVEWLGQLLQSDHDAVWVTETEGTVNGWLHLFRTIRLESGVFAEIGGLVVDGQQRGQQLGRQLVDKAKDWCRERGIGVLKVRSNVIREGAHRFYCNNGFRETKAQKIFEAGIPA